MTMLFGAPADRGFQVRYWDGSVEPQDPSPAPSCVIVLQGPWALRSMLLPPTEIAAAEAYLRDDFDVEGDMEAVMALAQSLSGSIRSPLRLARILSLARQLPQGPVRESMDGRTSQARRGLARRHSRKRDATSVRSHYDVGNDFYALWLDQRLVYSCAYFPTGNEDVDEAQEAKLDYICRKLRLKPGETLLDIGCGWGGLVLYAAERYGVRATGITLSREQAGLARERVAAAGLSDRATIEVRDYRDLAKGAVFDKVVSIGMLEHVGRANMHRYFAVARRAVRAGGLFLAHGIVEQGAAGSGNPLSRVASSARGEGRFIQRYVFPDGELLHSWELARAAAGAGWEVRDLENLREHYERTLRHWVKRLEERHVEAARLVGEPTYRVWRLYMSGAAHGFSAGDLGLVQLLLSSSGARGRCELPPTRDDLYRDR